MKNHENLRNQAKYCILQIFIAFNIFSLSNYNFKRVGIVLDNCIIFFITKLNKIFKFVNPNYMYDKNLVKFFSKLS